MKVIYSTALSLLILCVSLFAQSNIRDITEVGPKTGKINRDNYTNVYYISQVNGSDKQGNGTVDNPWGSISYALNQVRNLSENNKVAFFVANGTYTGHTLEMISYVDLYGGFDHATWLRDIYKYRTILDGEHQRRVVVGADNSVLDGFVVTGGLSRSHGAGILCDDTSPQISNCFIEDNFVLEPENFNNNRIHQSGNHGGGIACRYNSFPVIENNLFFNNKTSIGNGGAISFYGMLRMKGAPERAIVDNVMEGGWQPVVKNNVFIHNVSGVNDIGRTRSSNGAAISCAFEARPIIENNLIVCNQAKGRSDAGGIYSEDFSYPIIKGNWILGNISDDDGGGIYTNHTGHAVITQNYIAGNWTLGNGAGGIRISKEGRASIFDNIIVHNQTGGGVVLVDGYMELKNNIIMNNKGNAAIRFSNHFNYISPSTISGNIISKNESKMAIETAYDGQVRIENNNMGKLEWIDGNFSKTVNIDDDAIELTIKNMEFDLNSFQTVIKVSEDLGNKSLVGRTIRINQFWSVIQRVEKGAIFVWGRYDWRSSEQKKLIILSEYTK